MPNFWGDVDETKLPTYEKSRTTKYGDYSTLSSQMPDIKSTAELLMSGKLSAEEKSMMFKDFETGLARNRTGAYGMPVGAQKSLEVASAQNLSLKGALMAQERRMQALPYLQFMSGENQYKDSTGRNENARVDNFNANQNAAKYGADMSKAQYIEENSGGFGKFMGGILAQGATAAIDTVLPSSWDRYINKLTEQPTQNTGGSRNYYNIASAKPKKSTLPKSNATYSNQSGGTADIVPAWYRGGK